jgi:hypothetical protein
MGMAEAVKEEIAESIRTRIVMVQSIYPDRLSVLFALSVDRSDSVPSPY